MYVVLGSSTAVKSEGKEVIVPVIYAELVLVVKLDLELAMLFEAAFKDPVEAPVEAPGKLGLVSAPGRYVG